MYFVVYMWLQNLDRDSFLRQHKGKTFDLIINTDNFEEHIDYQTRINTITTTYTLVIMRLFSSKDIYQFGHFIHLFIGTPT